MDVETFKLMGHSNPELAKAKVEVFFMLVEAIKNPKDVVGTFKQFQDDPYAICSEKLPQHSAKWKRCIKAIEKEKGLPPSH